MCGIVAYIGDKQAYPILINGLKRLEYRGYDSSDGSYEKIISNIQEVKSRKGKVIAIVSEHDEVIDKMADYTIEVPASHDAFMPLISVIPLQLLSYHIAIMRGCNVDQPRNLAKSVTVE